MRSRPIGVSALGYAAWPIFPVVVAAATLHAAASCVLGPAIAAISLGLVGPLAIGERLGRNARYASLGNGVAAAVMGAADISSRRARCSLSPPRCSFPALAGAARASAREDRSGTGARRAAERRRRKAPRRLSDLLRKRPLLILAGCVMLFHLANAAMLPLMGSVLTMRSSQWATVLIAACIVVPQLVVALISPWVGRQAQPGDAGPVA